MKLKIGPHFVGDDETTCVITGAGANNRIFNMTKKLIGIAIYEKAMNNGYPMAEIVGKWDVMDAAQNTFISSTYRTERIGPMASIATINKMQETNIPSHICKIGDMIRAALEKLAQENVDDVFGILRKAIGQGNVKGLLNGLVAHVEFKRLT